MNWNKWIRQTHRWLSMIFTAAVLLDTAFVLRGRYSPSLGIVAVVPLFLLLFTGLYLFALPYATKWRSARRAEAR